MPCVLAAGAAFGAQLLFVAGFGPALALPQCLVGAKAFPEALVVFVDDLCRAGPIAWNVAKFLGKCIVADVGVTGKDIDGLVAQGLGSFADFFALVLAIL